MSETARCFNYKHVKVGYFRSSANGQVEIANKLCTTLLRKVVSNNPQKWHEAAKYITFELNTMKRAVLHNMSSFEVLYGMTPHSPVDNLLKLKTKPFMRTSIGEDTIANLECMRELVRCNLKKSITSMTKQYNKNACP